MIVRQDPLNIYDRFRIEHKNCKSPAAPPVDGLSIDFAPQGF